MNCFKLIFVGFLQFEYWKSIGGVEFRGEKLMITSFNCLPESINFFRKIFAKFKIQILGKEFRKTIKIHFLYILKCSFVQNKINNDETTAGERLT